jgi:hypothetical protein
MEPIYMDVKTIIGMMETELKTAIGSYEKLSRYYCEDPKDVTSDIFF